MPKRKRFYKLKEYVAAVELMAERHGFSVTCAQGAKGGVRFEVFIKSEQDGVPCDMWTIHMEHSKAKEVWSREDYKKPDRCFGGKPGEFLEILEDYM